jgi:hypothetical protein
MYQISQIFVSNFGYRDAFFPNRLIDLRRGNDVASSVMLFAENGRGKTSFLSLMLHMFVPRHERFVQYLQKKGNHRFEHYFHENKPSLYMIELVRQPKGQLFSKKEPALVLGVYARKMGDNRVDETFFKFYPGEGTQFSDLEPVRLTQEGVRLDWSNADVATWIKKMKATSEERDGLAFRTFDVQKLWTEALADDGFRLNDYATMIAMSTREGGLDAFMTCKDSSDMLGKIHELFVNETEYAEEIGQINYFLEKNQDLPALRAQLTAFEVALEKEGAFVDQLFIADEAEDALKKVQRELKGLRLNAESRKNAVKDQLAQARIAETEIKAAVKTLEQEKGGLYYRSEASRIAIAAAELATTDAQIATLSASRAEANRKKQVHDRIFRDAQRKIGLSGQIATLETQIAERQEKQASRLEPVRKAGSIARAVFAAAITVEKDKLLHNETRRQAGQKTIEALAGALSALDSRKAVISLRLSQVDHLIAQQQEIGSEAEAYISGRDEGSVSACVTALEDRLRENESQVKNAHDEKQAISGKLGSVEAEIRQIRKQLETYQKSSDRLATQVDNVSSIETELREGLLREITAEEGTDLTSEDFSQGIDSQRGVFSRRAEELRTQLEGLKVRLDTIEGAGSFEDEDVLKALEQCQKAGLKSVRPFVLWLSEQGHLTADEAGQIVENNLDVALGLIVTEQSEFALARDVFDREAWKLKKPIGLSFFDSAFYGRLTARVRDPNFFAFSAHNDYAYNSRSKIEVIDKLQEQIQKKTTERKELVDIVARHDELLSKLATMRKIGQGKSVEVLTQERDQARSRHETALLELETLDETLDNLTKQLEAVEVENLTAAAAVLKGEIEQGNMIIRRQAQIEADLAQHGSPQGLAAEAIAIDDAVAVKTEERLRNIGEVAALTNNDRAHITRSSELNFQREQIEHYVADADLNIVGWSIEDATRQYDLAKLEYERDQDISDLVNMDNDKLIRFKSEFATLGTGIEKTFRDIARELASSQDALQQSLKDWLDMPVAEIDGHVGQLYLEITAADAGLKQLSDARVTLKHDTGLREGFEAAKVKPVLDTLLGTDLDSLRQLHNSSKEDYARTSADLETKNTEGQVSDATIRRLASSETELVRLEKRLIKVRWDAVEPLPSPGIDFDNVDSAVRSIETLIDLEDRLFDSFSREEKIANKLHSAVVGYILEQEKVLRVPEIVERFRRFEQTNYKSRADIGRELYRRIGQIGEALVSEIETLATSESELLVVVGRLFEHALERILKAVSIKVPAHAKSQFAGSAILQLPEKLNAKALKEYPVDEIARRAVEDIRQSGSAPKLTTMASLSVQLLNILSQALVQRDFELMILKPVVGAKIQYDVLHKMTGSGGQTITAALLLYLVATNIAGASVSDELLGFLILDNPIGAANNTQLVQTQLSSAKDFGVQMISTTGILDDYLSAYETVVQFSASNVRQGLTEVDLEVVANGKTEINFFDFELHGAGDEEAA